MFFCVPPFLVLTVQLEALQLVAGDASSVLNAWGDTLEARLQDIHVRAREVVW
jgi:hypothetical protein